MALLPDRKSQYQNMDKQSKKYITISLENLKLHLIRYSKALLALFIIANTYTIVTIRWGTSKSCFL
jgi:hypothetical protein